MQILCVVVVVNAEFADAPKTGGWVLYDADCPFCVRMIRRFGPLLASRRFSLLPLQTPWVRSKLALPESQLFSEMRLLLPDGTHFGGADALIEISRHYWWAWPLRQIARLPPVRSLLRCGYRWVARRRNCAIKSS